MTCVCWSRTASGRPAGAREAAVVPATFAALPSLAASAVAAAAAAFLLPLGGDMESFQAYFEQLCVELSSRCTHSKKEKKEIWEGVAECKTDLLSAVVERRRRFFFFFSKKEK